VSGAIRQDAEDVLLKVRVQPRASRTEIAGIAGDTIRIRLTAPPVEGAANEALIEFLAQELAVSRGSITLRSGRSSRNKSVAIRGVTAERVASRLGLSGPSGAPAR